MPNWSEVFDNERVQFLTRQQATKLVRILVGAFALSATGIVVGFYHKLFFPGIIAAVLVIWAVAFWWISWRLQMLRRVVWCVKISDRRVEAYDYTRKKLSLDWTKVERVEINSEGLVLAGPNFYAFEIPQLFTDFSALSHRIVALAELYEIPISVEGTSWQKLDVYELYPFLTEDASQGSE